MKFNLNNNDENEKKTILQKIKENEITRKIEKFIGIDSSYKPAILVMNRFKIGFSILLFLQILSGIIIGLTISLILANMGFTVFASSTIRSGTRGALYFFLAWYILWLGISTCYKFLYGKDKKDRLKSIGFSLPILLILAAFIMNWVIQLGAIHNVNVVYWLVLTAAIITFISPIMDIDHWINKYI